MAALNSRSFGTRRPGPKTPAAFGPKAAIADALAKPMSSGAWDVGFEFRPSNCPFCCRFAALSLLLPQPIQEDWHSNFYLGVGTFLHSLTQRWLAQTNFLLGNWRCLSCQHSWGPALSPQTCPRCGGPTEYEELTLYGPYGIKGHCDGILWFSDASYLLEIKTTSLKYLGTIEQQDWHQSHVTQASMYVSMANQWLAQCSDRQIRNICFLYVPRDNPTKYEVLVRPHDPTALTVNSNRYNLVTQAMKSGDFASLPFACDNDGHAFGCQWRSLCFPGPGAPSAVEILTQQWRQRHQES